MLAGDKGDYNHMTMVKRIKRVAAGEFKARCLALLDLVAETGEELVVTKRGKPVARLLPAEAPPGLRGSVVWESDLVSPVGDRWDADE
jgi:prevent-host-death family protein